MTLRPRSIVRLLQNRNKWREPFGAPLASPLASDEKSDGCRHGTRIRERFQVKDRSLKLSVKITTTTKRSQNQAPCHMPRGLDGSAESAVQYARGIGRPKLSLVPFIRFVESRPASLV